METTPISPTWEDHPSGAGDHFDGQIKPLMKPSNGLYFKTSVLILVMVVFGPLGNVLLSMGMKHAGAATAWAPAEMFHIFTNVFSTGAIWLGVASLIAFFVANMLVLSLADYSYVQPASSMAYGVVALLGYFMLGESISPTRWLGVAVICVGVLVVGRTPPRTTEKV
jgi:drug/metabolite transporter (DMT)-like permease